MPEFHAANSDTYRPQYKGEHDGKPLLFLTHFSEFIVLDEDTPALYRGKLPWKGLKWLSPRGQLNQILQELSLRWLLLREILSVAHKNKKIGTQ